MIQRHLTAAIARLLGQFPAVALLGPRQVGKTTLAWRLERQGRPSIYLDLENPSDLKKLENPVNFLGAQRGKLVIVDEVHRAPELFQVLRRQIDERVLAGEAVGQFLLLGSASIDLLRQSSETLAGRIVYSELGPLGLTEIEPVKSERLWMRGGFPRSFLAETDIESATWRENFIRTYLERDIPMLGTRVPVETLRRFLTMLAHNQSGLLNAAHLARGLAVDGKTVMRYLDLMIDLQLVRRLTPQQRNGGKRLVRSPKVYIRDSGLVHSLLRLGNAEQVLGHPVCNASWEGFVIETLIRAAPARTKPFFYRTATGDEIDLLLELPGGETWVIEIKPTTAPRVEKGFRTALADIKPSRAFLCYVGTERYSKGGGIVAIGVRELAQELARKTRS